MEPIISPTEETDAVADHCDKLIEAYLDHLKNVRTMGKYESELEYYTAMKLMVRNLEGLVTLVREDLVLVPPAAVLARTIFEASVRSRWTFIPQDPYVREARWLLHLRTGATESRKLSECKHACPSDRERFRDNYEVIRKFSDEIGILLGEKGYQIPKQLPNLSGMLGELDQPQLYKYYIKLSGFAHSNFNSGNLYRKNLGCGKELGEFVTLGDWYLPFEVAFMSFLMAARDFLYWMDGDADSFMTAANVQQFREKLERIIDP